MEKVKMFIFGVVALALFCFFRAPMVQAQVLDGTTHQIKLSGSFAAVEPGMGFSKGGGSEGGAVVLRSTGPNAATGGFDYDINVLDDTGPGICDEVGPIGTLSTYTGENEAIVDLDIDDFPEPGQTLIGRLFAQVKITPGKTGLKTVAGWAEVEDGVPPDPDGISKKAQLKAKEKTLEKLGLQCTLP
jgi:hypothetical protein